MSWEYIVEMVKRRYIRSGQEIFRGWVQIGEVVGLEAETVRRTWKERMLPVWHERGRPVTSRTALAEYAREKLKLAAERGYDGRDIKRAVRKSSSRKAINGDPH